MKYGYDIDQYITSSSCLGDLDARIRFTRYINFAKEHGLENKLNIYTSNDNNINMVAINGDIYNEQDNKILSHSNGVNPESIRFYKTSKNTAMRIRYPDGSRCLVVLDREGDMVDMFQSNDGNDLCCTIADIVVDMEPMRAIVVSGTGMLGHAKAFIGACTKFNLQFKDGSINFFNVLYRMRTNDIGSIVVEGDEYIDEVPVQLIGKELYRNDEYDFVISNIIRVSKNNIGLLNVSSLTLGWNTLHKNDKFTGVLKAEQSRTFNISTSGISVEIFAVKNKNIEIEPVDIYDVCDVRAIYKISDKIRRLTMNYLVLTITQDQNGLSNVKVEVLRRDGDNATKQVDAYN